MHFMNISKFSTIISIDSKLLIIDNQKRSIASLNTAKSKI